MHNTAGDHCEKCADGFWGDAHKVKCLFYLLSLILSQIMDCKACNCLPQGTVKKSFDQTVYTCDQSIGQCDCLPNVVGKYCTVCKVRGEFNVEKRLSL